MTKKLLQLSVVAFTLIFILNACRTDETLNSEKRTQNEKISAFQKYESIHAQEIRNPKIYYSKNGDSTQLSYGEPFAEVIGNFLESHPNYAQRIENEVGEIDLNVVSQTFGEEEKALLFPIKDYSTGKVKAVWGGVINKDRDFVRFYYMLNNSVEVQTIIESFQEHYDNRSLSKEAVIEEVIIYFPIPLGSDLPWWWYDNNYDGAPSGGGVGGGMSGDGGLHGGGNGNYSNTSSNPCTQTKSIINNSKSKPSLDALKDQTSKKGELGVKFKKDGTPSELIPGEAHSVNFGDKTGYAGAYHNHTSTGIPMFAPGDIDQLLGFALAQGNYGDPSSAYLGMVAPTGIHYVMVFSGTYNDALVSFSQDQIDALARSFQTRNSIYMPSSGVMTNELLEKLFLNTLKDMRLDGKINLQRIENGGIVKSITKNTDGSTSAAPCP